MYVKTTTRRTNKKLYTQIGFHKVKILVRRLPEGGFAHAEACQHLAQGEQAPVDGASLFQSSLAIIPSRLHATHAVKPGLLHA